MVDRWFGHFRRGRFVHDNIAALLPASWGLDRARLRSLLAHAVFGIGISLPRSGRRCSAHNVSVMGNSGERVCPSLTFCITIRNLL